MGEVTAHTVSLVEEMQQGAAAASALQGDHSDGPNRTFRHLLTFPNRVSPVVAKWFDQRTMAPYPPNHPMALQKVVAFSPGFFRPFPASPGFSRLLVNYGICYILQDYHSSLKAHEKM